MKGIRWINTLWRVAWDSFFSMAMCTYNCSHWGYKSIWSWGHNPAYALRNSVDEVSFHHAICMIEWIESADVLVCQGLNTLRNAGMNRRMIVCKWLRCVRLLTEAALRRLSRNWSDVNFYNPSALRAEASNTFPTSSEYVMPFTVFYSKLAIDYFFSAPNIRSHRWLHVVSWSWSRKTGTPPAFSVYQPERLYNSSSEKNCSTIFRKSTYVFTWGPVLRRGMVYSRVSTCSNGVHGDYSQYRRSTKRMIIIFIAVFIYEKREWYWHMNNTFLMLWWGDLL